MAKALVFLLLLVALALQVTLTGAGPASLANTWALCYAADGEKAGACGARTEAVPAA